MDTINWLQDWYKQNCDGDWEHSYGINIYTLDNPGWSVNIELTDTNLEFKNFETIQIYINENNWINCKVTNGKFIGGGDSDKLETILKIFKEWVIINEKAI